MDIKFVIGWSIGVSNFILTVFLYFKSKNDKYKKAIDEYIMAINKYEESIASGSFDSINVVSKELDMAIEKIRSINE